MRVNLMAGLMALAWATCAISTGGSAQAQLLPSPGPSTPAPLWFTPHATSSTEPAPIAVAPNTNRFWSSAVESQPKQSDLVPLQKHGLWFQRTQASTDKVHPIAAPEIGSPTPHATHSIWSELAKHAQADSQTTTQAQTPKSSMSNATVPAASVPETAIGAKNSEQSYSEQFSNLLHSASARMNALTVDSVNAKVQPAADAEVDPARNPATITAVAAPTNQLGVQVAFAEVPWSAIASPQQISSGHATLAEAFGPALGESTKLGDWPKAISETVANASTERYALTDDQPSSSDVRASSVQAKSGQTDTPSQPRGLSEKLRDDSSSTIKASKPLLAIDSMTGPLSNTDDLFARLGLQDDYREIAAHIASGPRADGSNYVWMPAAYTWISPAFYHHPLYFEQPNLERYGLGRSRLVQPILSSVHFFGSIPLVPYKTLTHHPRERVYTLGNGRPGNCVPVQRGVLLGQSHVGEVAMFWEECSGY